MLILSYRASKSNQGRNFHTPFTVSSPGRGDLLQLGDIVLEYQAAGVDPGGVFGAHIPPVPGLIGDLGDGLGLLSLGVAEDEAILPGVLTQPGEGGGVLKAGVQVGEVGAVQVGGQAAVVLGIARGIHNPGGHLLGGGLVIALVQKLLGLVGIEGGLAGLGVTVIYLSPVFLSSSNHRYDTADYTRIDDLFGGDEGFKELVAAVKAKGMRLVLDGVFNHTGADSVYFNKFGTFPGWGAYQSKESPYYDWYTFYDYPDSYHCWWGSTVVPTVNKSAPGFRKLICGKGGVVDKWTKAGVDGWRLDVVDELPTDFVDLLCGAIRRAKKDAAIIGEVWEDASDKVSYGTWRPYFMGDELDGVTNYPFRRAIFDLILKGDREGFCDTVTSICEHYPKESLDACFTIIGSHDTVRALSALSGLTPPVTQEQRRVFGLSGGDYEFARLRLKAAAILQYTLPGVPCVYYGDEAGMQGYEDPLNRGSYPWGREDDDIIGHYRALGELRRRNAAALTGRLRFVGDGELTVFDRISDDGKDILRVFYNPCFHSVNREVYGKDAFTGEPVDVLTVPPLSACAVAYHAEA